MKTLFLILSLLIVGLHNAQAERLIARFSDLSLQNSLPGDIQLLKKQTYQQDIALLAIDDSIPMQARLSKIQILRSMPGILWVTQDQEIIGPQSIPNDPLINQQQNWQIPSQLYDAWTQQTDCRDTVIAIIDSGLEQTHPDLQNNLWHNPGEIPDNGLDDDANGKIDDVNGWNTINENNLIDDLFGHGTHVAGLIAAQGNNAEGVSGVCWQARLLPMKFLNRYGSGSVSDAVKAIYYILDLQNAYPHYHFIINNSWAANYNLALEQALQDASEAGILLINAAGNSAKNLDDQAVYPAFFSANNLSSVSIANLDTDPYTDDYTLNSTSNYGAQSITLAAPGTNILSTWPLDLGDESGYAIESGTSMATPIVSGISALLWQSYPELKAPEIRALLQNSANNNPELRASLVTPGRVLADAALQAASLGTPIGIGYIENQDGSTFLKGTNLEQVNHLTLDEKALAFELIDSSQLKIQAPGSLRCGYLQASDETKSSNRLYLDWTPNPPENLFLHHSETNQEYTLSWNSSDNVDSLLLQILNSDGSLDYEQFIENTTQTFTLSNFQETQRIRLQSQMRCETRTGEQITKLSVFSDEVSPSSVEIPVWQTQAISDAYLGQSYHIDLKTEHTSEITLKPLSDDDCFPEGLNLNNTVIEGIPDHLQNCSFTLQAHNGPYAVSEHRFEINIVESDQPLNLKTAEGIKLALKASNLQGAGLSKLTNNTWQLSWFQTLQALSQIEIDLENYDLNFTDAFFIDQDGQSVPLSGNLSDHRIETIYEDALSQTLINPGQFIMHLSLTSASNDLAEASIDDSRCFIASQIYHDKRNPQVQQLREIRDHLLENWPQSKPLVDFYYAVSPTLVEKCKRHPALCAPVKSAVSWQLDLLVKSYRFWQTW
ncbi:S8 family peptidase [Thiomicrorhabdus sp.]|uniref:S8 family peptidase n=1 Tax=Thiomicrorhabdus sp. TaxID=2039724 RepID=UPI0029C743E2|nr:S8 family peptidase [Thiomicrorhabdus sp.]